MTGPWRYSDAEFIEGFVPDVYSYKSVLYVGASPARQILAKEFKDHGAAIDLVEVWPPNLEALSKTHTHIFDNFILGDVRKLKAAVTRTYECVCWWHGPEHVTKEEFEPTLEALKAYATKLIVVAAPHGSFPQGVYNGNHYEVHHQDLFPEDFHRIGWHAVSFGEPNDPWSWVVAWFRK